MGETLEAFPLKSRVDGMSGLTLLSLILEAAVTGAVFQEKDKGFEELTKKNRNYSYFQPIR